MHRIHPNGLFYAFSNVTNKIKIKFAREKRERERIVRIERALKV